MTIRPCEHLSPPSRVPMPSWRRSSRRPPAQRASDGRDVPARADASGPPDECPDAGSQLLDEVRTISQADPAFTQPLVHLVAANLAAGGMAPGRFAVEMAALSRHLQAAHGAEPEPVYQALSIAILCRRDPHGNVRPCDIERMDTVYALMCRRRWWITIAQDLPLAALMAGVNAPAEHIDRDCERTYAGLMAYGYCVGLSSQIAACVLCLLPIAQDQALQRFLALAQAFRRAAITQLPPPAELSTLCLLDLDPQRIAQCYRDVLADPSDASVGRPSGLSGTMPVIGRTFQEVLPSDRSLGGLSARISRVQRQHLERDFLACTCVVAMAAMDAQAVHAA